nr:DUF933 domain-containing protein [Salinicoccus halodurans]
MEFTEEEAKYVKNFHLLTQKPMLYVANVAEMIWPVLKAMRIWRKSMSMLEEKAEVIVISAKVEEEIAVLDEDEKEMFLEELGISESGLDKLIKASYDLLGLATYFTAGVQEVRAWTFKKGMTAPECAGIIHTDFKKGFIRAETVSYDDLVSAGSEVKAKEAGKVRLEGKEYIMKDGDVVHFRFNV